jgi:hypothetical protein
MPHVVIYSNIYFNLIHEQFQVKEHRYSLQDKMIIIKLTESFQNKSRNKILIKTTSIENNSSTEYLIELMKKFSQITIRLYPLTYPSHRTANVFRSLSLVTNMIRETEKDIMLVSVRTNIQSYI